MTTHDKCDHEPTKAARAKCRRENASLSPTADKVRDRPVPQPRPKSKKAASGRRVTEPMNTSLPHAYDEDAERPGRCYVCKLTQRARVHDEVPTESRLHAAMNACKHPADSWILKGATRKKSGHWYCTCGKFMGDEGPADLRNLINGPIFGRRR